MVEPRSVPTLDASTVSLLDVVPDALVAVDGQGAIVWINEAALDLLGYERDQLVGRSVDILVPDEDAPSHAAHRADFATDPRRRPMATSRRLNARRADGSLLPVLISLGPVQTDTGPLVVAAVRDISDYVAGEMRLAEERRRRAIAEDHERIARDLHDSVIQELFAVGLALQALASERTDERLVSRLDQAIASIDDTIRGIRRAIFDVRSHPTLALGARAQISDIVASMATALGFEPQLRFVGDDFDMPPTVAEHVAPVVREALANVAKHARATRVEVVVELDDSAVMVRVTDDGQGFDDDDVGHRGGLVNLARRAALLGGGLEVRRADAGGTALEWRVPVRR